MTDPRATLRALLPLAARWQAAVWPHTQPTQELIDDNAGWDSVLRRMGAKAAADLAAFRPERKATSADEDYDVIRADLVNRVEEAFMDFVSQSARVTSYLNAANRALTEDIPAAFGRGYSDAGGDTPEDDDDAWVTSKQSAQLDFMAAAFDSLKEWRASENFTESDVKDRAEIWGGMLDGVYSEGKLRGSKNMKCYFDGDDGEHSCASCQRLKDGPPRSVSWILAHNAIPSPGNPEFDCECWKCQHNWFSVKTDEQMTF